MANVKITQLPIATAINSTDLVEIVQEGSNKQSIVSLFRGSVSPSGIDHIPNFLDEAGGMQNTSLIYGDSDLSFGKAISADEVALAIYPVGRGGPDINSMALISLSATDKTVDIYASKFIQISALGNAVGEEGAMGLDAEDFIQLNGVKSGVQINDTSLEGTEDAAFRINSTTRGFLPSRMSAAQIDLIDDGAGGVSEGLETYNSDVHAPVFYNGAHWVSSFNALQSMFEPTGFPMPDDISVTIDDVSRTITLGPSSSSFYFFVWAVRFDKTGPQSIVFPDTEGYHYIYYDQDGVLQQVDNPTVVGIEELIRMDAIAVIVYWDATNKESIYFTGNNELHGVQMDGSTHANMHFTDGTKYLQGAALNTINTGGTGNDDADAQFGVDLGIGLDEDRPFTAASVASTTGLPVHYAEGSQGNARRAFNAGFSVLVGGSGLVQFNEDIGGTFQLTEGGSGNYIWYHTFLTNNSPNGFITVPGVTDYSLVSTAKDAAADDLGAVIARNVGVIEKKPVGSVLYETKSSFGNAVKARLVPTNNGDYEDWRFENITSTVAPTSHNSLAGLNDGDPHSQYLPTDRPNNQTTIEQTNPIAGGYLLDGIVTSPYLRSIAGIAVSGQYAYAATFNDGLQILDVSDPENPIALGRLESGSGASPYLENIREVIVNGEFLYITSKADNAVQVVDVRDKANPVAAGSIVNNGSTILLEGATSAALKGDILFVGSSLTNSIQAIDVSNPYDLIARGNIASAGPPIILDNIVAMDFSSSGNYLICADKIDDAVQILDISDPDNLTAVSNIVHGPPPYLNGISDLKVRGSYVYCAVSNNKAVQILDISDPFNIVAKGYISDGGGAAEPYLNGANQIVLSGDYAYVAQAPSTPGAANNGIQVLNISDVNNITTAGRIADGEGVPPYLQEILALEISGGYLHVASTEGLNAYQTIKVGNFKVPTADIGTIESDLIETRNLKVDNNLSVGNSLTVGGVLFADLGADLATKSIRGWASLTNTTSVASGVNALITFNQLETSSSEVTLDTSAIVISIPGYYVVSASIEMPAVITGDGRVISLEVDRGGGFIIEEENTVSPQEGPISTQVIRLGTAYKHFAIGDKIRLVLHQDTGVSQSILDDPHNTCLKVIFFTS